MKLSLCQFPLLVAALSAFAAVPAVFAQTAPSLYVVKPVENFTVQAGTATSKVKLKKTFGRTATAGEVVRFTTTLGNVDVELLKDDAPVTVANFLNYVSTGAYATSFFHRNVPNFILQGGGYSVTNDTVYTITQHDPVVNEYKVSNTRGTIAMAKLDGNPDSATDQWFFNLDDNSANLDHQNGGFTVFGRVLGDGMNVVDNIARLTVVNAGGTFSQLPVVGSTVTPATVTTKNLVYTSVAPITSSPSRITDLSVLKIKINNSNPDLVTPALNGNNLVLTYVSGGIGSAKITLKATDPVTGTKAKVRFTVTVQ